MRSLWHDLRICIRTLARRPGPTGAAILVLALAIGANAALFGVVRSVLFRSPASDPERLRVLWEQDRQRGRDLIELSYSSFSDVRAQTSTFEDMAAFGSVNWGSVLTVSGEAFHESSAGVSWSFFETLAARPLLGRTFRPEDDEVGAAHVVELSYELWRERFGGDEALVGKTVQIEGDTNGPELFTVVGVMPRTFDFPRGARLWLPVRPRIAAAAARDPSYSLSQLLRGLGVLFVVGRLRPGVTVTDAQSELDVLSTRLGREHGWAPRSVVVTPFLDFYLGGSTRSSIRILWGAVGLVLLIACGNVSGLLLVRTVANRRELAIRRALGAGRSRILREILLEGVVLATCGGIVGVALAAAGLRLLVAAAPADVPGVSDASLDAAVLGLTAALSIVAGLLSAIAPAWRASLPSSSGRRQSYGPSVEEGRWVHGGFVVLQLALSVALLVAAGLVLESFRNLHETDLGYDWRGVLTFKVPFLDSRYPTVEEKDALAERLLERLEAQPGVLGAAFVYQRPLENGPIGMDESFIAEGQPVERTIAEDNPMLEWEAVTPAYFDVIGIRLSEGRRFDRTDSKEAPRVAIVGESLARRMWPGESAVGKRLWLTSDGRSDSGEPRFRTVVGIVEDARSRELTSARLQVYVPFLQSRSPVRDAVVRTAGDPLALVAAVRGQMHSLDPGQPLDGVTTLEALVNRAVAPFRFTAMMLTGFASVALALAATGLFAMMAYSVSRRIPEIGVRMALGATARQVLRRFVGRGLILTLIGGVIGLLLALGLSHILSGVLYGIAPNDPRTYIGVAALLLAVCLAGCFVPARRAAKVNPMEALRHD
jgi:putative ABC transport system permease protein